MQEDSAAYQNGTEAGEKYGARGYVKAGVSSLPGFLVESEKNGLDRAIDQFRGQHHADASHEQTPFDHAAAQYNRCRQHERREEEVNKKAGMAANPQLPAAQCVA